MAERSEVFRNAAIIAGVFALVFIIFAVLLAVSAGALWKNGSTPYSPTVAIVAAVVLAIAAAFAAAMSYYTARASTQKEGVSDVLTDGNATVSFVKDIRPLFRQLDVDSMKQIRGFDLSKYDDVKEQAPRILTRLKEGTMPCDGAWPANQVDLFSKWVEAGTPP